MPASRCARSASRRPRREAAGIRVDRVRASAPCCSAALTGGLAGATLVLAQAGTFAENMSAGRGFIAIAIVVLGRWHPLGVALAALRLRRRERAAVPAAGARTRAAVSALSRAAVRAHARRRSRASPAGCGARRRWRESTRRRLSAVSSGDGALVQRERHRPSSPRSINAVRRRVAEVAQRRSARRTARSDQRRGKNVAALDGFLVAVGALGVRRRELVSVGARSATSNVRSCSGVASWLI